MFLKKLEFLSGALIISILTNALTDNESPEKIYDFYKNRYYEFLRETIKIVFYIFQQNSRKLFTKTLKKSRFLQIDEASLKISNPDSVGANILN